jgi:hypothetical protein
VQLAHSRFRYNTKTYRALEIEQIDMRHKLSRKYDLPKYLAKAEIAAAMRY